jgi:hypothetical protein
MAAGAIAIAAGPLIGGLATTYASWRYVFAGEVVVVIGILALARRVQDAPADERAHIDVVGALLAAAGLGLAVFGVLRSSIYGWFLPKPGGPSWVGLSPVVWLVLGGGLVLWAFVLWERRVEQRGGEPLVTLGLFRVHQLTGGLSMFFFQYLVQAGLFFAIPLYLSVSLGLSAIDTGVRILPLSVTLLLFAAGVPRFLPQASPRRVVRFGLFAMFVGIVVLFAAMDADADAAIVTGPLLLVGAGIGALSSQLGAVTVSSVPDDRSPEVGGLQNTATNLGASIGTALAGSLLIAALTASFLAGIEANPDVPDDVVNQANVQLAAGAPFVSDAQLQTALDDAGVTGATAEAVVDVNQQARIDGLRVALIVLAGIALVALFFSGRIPDRQPGSTEPEDHTATRSRSTT